jgi:hypothetical protein
MVNLIYPHHEISRIMTAAVVNPQFRQSLLANPLRAIEAGFGDETFELAQDEAEHLARIRATSLAEFAAKIILT